MAHPRRGLWTDTSNTHKLFDFSIRTTICGTIDVGRSMVRRWRIRGVVWATTNQAPTNNLTSKWEQRRHFTSNPSQMVGWSVAQDCGTLNPHYTSPVAQWRGNKITPPPSAPRVCLRHKRLIAATSLPSDACNDTPNGTNPFLVILPAAGPTNKRCLLNLRAY